MSRPPLPLTPAMSVDKGLLEAGFSAAEMGVAKAREKRRLFRILILRQTREEIAEHPRRTLRGQTHPAHDLPGENKHEI